LGIFPWWLVAAILLRDLVIVTGATVYNFRVEAVQPEPTLVSKLNTVLQIVLAAVGVIQLGIEASARLAAAGPDLGRDVDRDPQRRRLRARVVATRARPGIPSWPPLILIVCGFSAHCS
jgi:phosphatidylglycerophosphate synthase